MTIHEAAQHVDLEGHLVGEVALGVWCPTCEIPSAARGRVVVISPDDPTSFVWSGTVTACGDCGSQHVEADRRPV